VLDSSTSAYVYNTVYEFVMQPIHEDNILIYGIRYNVITIKNVETVRERKTDNKENVITIHLNDFCKRQAKLRDRC